MTTKWPWPPTQRVALTVVVAVINAAALLLAANCSCDESSQNCAVVVGAQLLSYSAAICL